MEANEFSHGPETQQPPEKINPTVARGIVNYFLIAKHLSPESFEPGDSANPIQRLSDDRPIEEYRLDEFLEDLGRHRLKDQKKHFSEIF